MKKLVVALAVIGALMAGSTAHAQDSGSYNEDLNRTPVLSATVVSSGAQFTVTVDCLVGETVVFEFEGATVSVACADGTASTTFTAPTAPGTYGGTADFPDAPTETFSITVQSVAATTNPSGVLPATGSDGAQPTVMIAAILLLAGVGMFGVAQRRRRNITPVAV